MGCASFICILMQKKIKINEKLHMNRLLQGLQTERKKGGKRKEKLNKLISSNRFCDVSLLKHQFNGFYNIFVSFVVCYQALSWGALDTYN